MDKYIYIYTCLVATKFELGFEHLGVDCFVVGQVELDINLETRIAGLAHLVLSFPAVAVYLWHYNDKSVHPRSRSHRMRLTLQKAPRPAYSVKWA